MYYKIETIYCVLTGGDSLSIQNDKPFSTKDQDYEGHGFPRVYHGAWWYGYVSYSNLNGPYLGRHDDYGLQFWSQWRQNYSLKKTKMMIKRVEIGDVFKCGHDVTKYSTYRKLR